MHTSFVGENIDNFILHHCIIKFYIITVLVTHNIVHLFSAVIIRSLAQLFLLFVVYGPYGYTSHALDKVAGGTKNFGSLIYKLKLLFRSDSNVSDN
jgi:hypothetical protein